MKKISILALSVMFVVPMVALAATVNDVLQTIFGIIDTATPIVVALALLYFFWGLAKYILNQSNEEEKGKGRDIMIWGIVAIFVMLSVFGIVEILQNTFDVERSVSPNVPQVDVSNTNTGGRLQGRDF